MKEKPLGLRRSEVSRWLRAEWWAFLLTAFLWVTCTDQRVRAGSSSLKRVEVTTPSELNKAALFWYRMPSQGNPSAMLLLVPGCNGDGRGMLNEAGPWTQFADDWHLVLVGPSFQTTMEEVHSHRGYYYPELWSGAATLNALDQIRAQTGVRSNKLLVFGFSAGAHFAHRFALWKPERVTAFVAYSAGWWDAPKASLRNTPGLIMCGEADERYQPTYAFFSQGVRMGLPLIWRSYAGVGHELKPQIVRMAQAFLGFYAEEQTPQYFVGDIQAYRFYESGSAEARRVPQDSRVMLPSRHVAEVWQVEQ